MWIKITWLHKVFFVAVVVLNLLLKLFQGVIVSSYVSDGG